MKIINFYEYWLIAKHNTLCGLWVTDCLPTVFSLNYIFSLLKFSAPDVCLDEHRLRTVAVACTLSLFIQKHFNFFEIWVANASGKNSSPALLALGLLNVWIFSLHKCLKTKHSRGKAKRDEKTLCISLFCTMSTPQIIGQ